MTMDYLALLEESETFVRPNATSKTPDSDFTQFVQSADSVQKVKSSEYRRWRINLAGREPFTVTTTPPGDRACMQRLYPGAEVTPLPERESTRTATPAEAAELAELIGKVLKDDPGKDEALGVALLDVDAALDLYRRLARAVAVR